MLAFILAAVVIIAGAYLIARAVEARRTAHGRDYSDYFKENELKKP